MLEKGSMLAFNWRPRILKRLKRYIYKCLKVRQKLQISIRRIDKKRSYVCYFYRQFKLTEFLIFHYISKINENKLSRNIFFYL